LGEYAWDLVRLAMGGHPCLEVPPIRVGLDWAGISVNSHVLIRVGLHMGRYPRLEVPLIGVSVISDRVGPDLASIVRVSLVMGVRLHMSSP
jgi:hypothetical protein